MTTPKEWRARADAEAEKLLADNEWAIGNRHGVGLIVALAWMIGHNAGSKETRDSMIATRIELMDALEEARERGA